MNPYHNHKIHIKKHTPKGWFSGYASVFDVCDLQQEYVARGAFQKSLATDGLPKMLWQHDPTIPIGKWLKLEEREYGLYVEGQIFTGLQKGQEALVLMQEGVLDGLSIGYEVKKFQPTKKGRILQEVKLLEVSLVTFPANVDARILDIKMAEEDVLHRIGQLTQIIQSQIEENL